MEGPSLCMRTLWFLPLPTLYVGFGFGNHFSSPQFLILWFQCLGAPQKVHYIQLQLDSFCDTKNEEMCSLYLEGSFLWNVRQEVSRWWIILSLKCCALLYPWGIGVETWRMCFPVKVGKFSLCIYGNHWLLDGKAQRRNYTFSKSLKGLQRIARKT